jgi:dethiobiotin synthetase
LSTHFITGAGTDIGKTYVTALLARQRRASGRPVIALKPVASGMPLIGDSGFAATDTAGLLSALGLPITQATVETCSPWRFKEPLSPDMAAAAEGRTVEFEALITWCRTKIASAPADAAVLIEGVGGVMSPVTDRATNLDWIKALDCPIVLVSGSYLGALNHALTAIETLKAHAVLIRALVLNESADSTVDFDATLDALRRFAPDQTIATLRRGAPNLDLDLD